MKLNGLILFIVAIILGAFLLPKFLFLGIFLTPFINDYLLRIAISIDILGNVVGGPLFNYVLQRDGYSFGNTTETISYVIAKNKYTNTLTGTGKAIAAILDFIDPGHTDLIKQRAIRMKYVN